MYEQIRRSRFITTLDRAWDRERALATLARIRDELPDATHYCWAFVAGPPGDSGRVGMSDDGEPHGTAGRPMLTTLLNAEVGQIVAVVARYYGGVKLGKGGLGRAYAGGVATALETLPTERLIRRTRRDVSLRHSDVDAARRIFDRLSIAVIGQEWGESVVYRLDVPDTALDALADALADLTHGAARLRSPEA